ncbi:MAG: FAD-binding protein [Alphaproteobacteria bacterium]|jgi:fumarate reductase flavoprotein subunit|nr:succinate dehydrogenase/fumarate reductase flavoprotein subunit [Rhodospirillaceae bacterium]MDP6404464.1 FAD-binding protein [Alphaproteobacteria bacterium]MDP6621751.1 FAD-binding protein [Alphaproteobacteria bacterium]
MEVERLTTDILILGSGGAGLFAALHAKQAAPELEVTVAVKGLLGKSGCTRMVQGGYNVALAEGDSIERHFMDTINGGQWINDQDLAWTLVTGAVERIHELENEIGCFFDRNPDGSVHQKAFAGQTFDRTVHKGDLTGIEIINRLAEQVWARNIRRLEEHRAVALVPAAPGADGNRLAGVLLVDVRSGAFRFVSARAVLLATGGGPTMYRYHTPSADKSCDGMALALRAGLELRDMEMVQFHPTGLVAGSDTRITGTIIEEGLRGAGGQLLDGAERRFMADYDARGERATRDIVSRAMFEEMRAGRTGPNGGLYITMRELDAGFVRQQFKGMVERCADCGFDLVGGLVEVVPTAHYMMGGLIFDTDCRTALAGLYAAGEDTGGVHGANRLGGNGVANSTVFGGIAGDSMAAALEAATAEPDETALRASAEACLRPYGRPPGDLNALRQDLQDLMWQDAGIMRTRDGLERALSGLEEMAAVLEGCGLEASDRAFDLAWHDWLNLESQILVGRAVVTAALARENSCGAHFREDFPDPAPAESAFHTVVRLDGDDVRVETRPARFSRVSPGSSLLDEGESK